MPSLNTINSVSSNIRDFLLNKNLLPTYPFISTSLNGSPRIGEPVLETQVNNGANVTPFGLPLEVEGILREQIAILPNQYKNPSSTAEDLISVEYIQPISISPNSTFPQGITSYPTGANDDVFNFGIMGKTIEGEFRKKASIKNLYLDVDKQVDTADWITLETAPITQQIKGYLDVYGGLNLGDSGGIQAANVIGSILNGQGLGLAKGGVVTNFDIRSSLAGRVLGATGIINDTKLGMIGGQQLALALANNAAFNVEQSILGSLNVQDNVLSLVKNGTLAGFRPNYQITVASGSGGKVLDYTARILGFTLPKSLLEDSGSIFLSESDTANIERANSMILNTGKGQVQAMVANINANLIGTTQHDNPDTTHFRSGYAPGYKDNRGQQAINPNLYAFYNSDKATIVNFITTGLEPIPEINYNRSGLIDGYGFTGLESSGLKGDSYVDNNIRTPTFSWGSDNNDISLVNKLNGYQSVQHDKKTLLGKTQILFNSKGMKNIVSTKGEMNQTPNQIQTAVVGGGISKGNAVMGPNNFDLDSGRFKANLKTAEETYCRSWTTFSRYEKLQNLVRSSGLNETVPYRQNIVGSVLDDFGNPKIAPYSTDNPSDPKKFMFSIENLAWNDNVQDLLSCEVGPGDLISGKKGRIMWFPPYNIQFNENTTVNWETSNFIGRGESVYTYNNTERSGTLSFQIIVDHPSYVNSFRGSDGPDDHYIASFFAGCIDPSTKFAEKLTVSEMSSLSTDIVKNPGKNVEPEKLPSDFDVFFPNDIDTIPTIYENGLENPGLTLIDYVGNPTGIGFGLKNYNAPAIVDNDTGKQLTSNREWVDFYNYGLNGKSIWHKATKVGDVEYNGILDPNFLPALKNYLTNICPTCKAHVTGFASSQGIPRVNKILAENRAKNVKDWLKANIPNLIVTMTTVNNIELPDTGVNGQDTDTLTPKLARKASVSFQLSPKLAVGVGADPVVKQPLKKINTKITNRFYTECSYFEQLTDTDYFVFDKFREKIKYFHPAFHSTTPEGLNSRLTFLNQCTRQGPTLEAQGANNLAFGRPPVCILRIGDFYNTKIIIDNVGIDYEPLVWDLNPEGVGVQPMIANVNMSFKFIGGSTLLGPINKLQNALSFNYYANTQVYDVRADYISKDPDLNTQTYKDNINIPSEETLLDDVSVINQMAANDALNNQEITDIPTPELTITGLIYNESLSLKDSDHWSLNLRLSIENGTGNFGNDAQTLSDKHYSLAIYNNSRTDYYELILDDKLLIEQLINPANISNYFRVPIKNSKNLSGMTDKLIRETVILALKNPNHTPSPNIQVIQLKLK